MIDGEIQETSGNTDAMSMIADITGQPLDGEVTPEVEAVVETKPEEVVEEAKPEDNVTESKPETVSKNSEPIVIDGRTFKNTEELVKTYQASSKEAKRLSQFEKAHNSIQLELENVKSNLISTQIGMIDKEIASIQPFAEKSNEELEMMTPLEQSQYFVDKRLAEKEIPMLKQQKELEKQALIKQAEEYKAHQEQVKIYIKETYTSMLNNPERYPNMKELEPTIHHIIGTTPSILGKPETPLILYYMAEGINSTKAKIASAKATTEASAKSTNAELAKSSSASMGVARTTPKTKVKTDMSDENQAIMNSYYSHS